MAGKYLKLFVDSLEKYRKLNDAEFGRLIRAALSYKATGVEVELMGREELLWDGMKLDIDRDNENYNDISSARAEAGKKGAEKRWQNKANMANANLPYSKNSKDGQDKDKDEDKDKDKEKNKGNTDVFPSSQRFPEESDEMKLSRLLFERMRKNNPTCKEPNFQTWCKHVDLLLRVDQHTPKEVQDVIVFCQKDAFWSANILSTKKLREKFDQLALKMQGRSVKGEMRGAPSESGSSYDMDELEKLIEKGGVL